jgi:ribosomal protein S17
MEVEKKKRQFTGVVASANMDKTVKVTVTHSIRHPKYLKTIVRHKSFLVHTDMEVKVGDTVTFVESRPYSKNVKSVVIAVIKK